MSKQVVETVDVEIISSTRYSARVAIYVNGSSNPQFLDLTKREARDVKNSPTDVRGDLLTITIGGAKRRLPELHS